MNGKAKILKLRLDELRRADIAWLRVRWREAFNAPAPPKISRDLLSGHWPIGSRRKPMAVSNPLPSANCGNWQRIFVNTGRWRHP